MTLFSIVCRIREIRYNLKVAILSPIVWRTPPRKYGPWEQVASNIAEGLAAAGADVTLFATGDSVTAGKLEWVAAKPYGENSEMDPKVWECLHIGHFMEQAHRFDILHNHYDFLPLTYSGLTKVPMVTTIHGFSSPKILPVFKKYNSRSAYVSISHSDRSPELDYAATVYNGIDESQFTFSPAPGDYLLFFGRIHPEKGTLEAIEIAKAAGKKLIISGLVQDWEYFNRKIRPLINEQDVMYAGNSGPEERNRLMSGALALLHPILFNEPFGLSVAEAMLCGTPVIAFNRGSMPELIRHKETGFLVSNVEEAAQCIDRLSSISRPRCREWSESMFSREQMIKGYMEVYQAVLAASSIT